MSAGSAAVIAKARAKYGGLLGLDEYKTLISKANVGEIVAQLKTYGDFCEDFSAVDNTVRRSQAERLMEKRLFRIYDELRKFCPGSKNKFYDFSAYTGGNKTDYQCRNVYRRRRLRFVHSGLSGLSDEYLFLRYSGTFKSKNI